MIPEMSPPLLEGYWSIEAVENSSATKITVVPLEAAPHNITTYVSVEGTAAEGGEHGELQGWWGLGLVKFDEVGWVLVGEGWLGRVGE